MSRHGCLYKTESHKGEKMEEFKYSGKMKRYFQAPIYMIALFVVGDALMYFRNVTYGIVISVAIAIYSVFVLWL